MDPAIMMAAPTPEQHTLTVALGERSYPIHIGTKLLSEAGRWIADVIPARRAVIVTDEHVAQYYLHRLTGALALADINNVSIILPAGEQIKCWEDLHGLTQQILEQAPDRQTGIIALGGGVVGDLTGVAASLVLRGLPFIQIPTTLLAQVDSSVGGKTGINTSYGKNTLGTFYQPSSVLIDTTTLQTLPKRQLLAGYAEIVKYGIIQNAALFDWLMENGKRVVGGDAEALQHAIATSCEIKAAIVAADEIEQGKRAWLNFGHTFAHALELETGYGEELLHGEAVAIGMVLALKLSHKLGYIDSGIISDMESHLADIGLCTRLTDIRDTWDIDALMTHMSHDKKAEHGKLTFILAKAIGEVCIAKDVEAAVVREVLEEEIK